MLKAGDVAPDFSLPDQYGNKRSLSEFRGKKVVLYFYPKDNTSGCTAEAEGFRDVFKEISDKNAVVIGVSKDSVSSHFRFAEKYSLPFILLSDEDKSVISASSHFRFAEKYSLPFILLSDEDKAVISAYGALKEKKLYGKSVVGVNRTTFLIDENGVIQSAYYAVRAAGHAEEIACSLNR